ncbi:MAG: Uncharacterised protein [Owenweeksia sp. TMED14]|nr:MAG: Uncharacterised protein [Owenweeksia sp. TMED14]
MNIGLKQTLFLTITSIYLFSCEPTIIPVNPNPINTNKVINGNITKNTIWYSDTVYQLAGRISVTSGNTLTIQPGTVIKGEAGTGSNASSLVISRGSKIMAEGTESLPIVFTSIADEITPEKITSGDGISSPNLTPNIAGLWGGLIVLGKAVISASNTTGDISEVQIEGIPTSDPNGLYGGSENSDNSGVLKYISIRHGGTNIGSGNEINGLTLGGVGSSTTIENIEVVSNQDDGFECFGGTVNLKNIVSWNVMDDGFDTDQSWGGVLDNFVIISPAGHVLELDGPEGAHEAYQTIKNGNVIASGDNTAQDLINVDNNTKAILSNIYFMDVVPGQKINRTTAPNVSFSDIVIDVDSLDAYINGNALPGITSGQSSMANINVFNWTWAHSSGAIK